MRHTVQGGEPDMHRHFQDGSGRIERRIHRTRAAPVPASARRETPVTAVPLRRKPRLIQPPENNLAGAERRGQRGHV